MADLPNPIGRAVDRYLNQKKIRSEYLFSRQFRDIMFGRSRLSDWGYAAELDQIGEKFSIDVDIIHIMNEIPSENIIGLEFEFGSKEAQEKIIQAYEAAYRKLKGTCTMYMMQSKLCMKTWKE